MPQYIMDFLGKTLKTQMLDIYNIDLNFNIKLNKQR